MMLFFFIVVSFFIFISTIGYGFAFTKFLAFNKLRPNYGLTGIIGLFFLSVLSSYSHLFLSHNYLHNIILIFFGLFLFFFYNSNTLKFKYLIYIFLLLFIFLIISKTNEDFGYYHLPNSLQFAQQKLQFGLGNLNHGFKHISSLFQLMSIHYLPIFEFKLFNLVNYLFFIFLILFILQELYSKKNNNHNISNIFLSLILVLFLVKFARLAEYGSDLSGQIVLSVYIFYIFEYLYNQRLNDEEKLEYIKIILLLLCFATTIKFISIIYGFFLILILTPKKIYELLKKKNFFYSSFIIASSIIFLFLNFSSTGCFVYPVIITCFSNTFNWAIDYETINYLKNHYELWAKAGLGPNIQVPEKELYVKSFNWVKHWYYTYFIGKFSDYILVIILITISYFILFNRKLFRKIQNYKNENKQHIYYFLSTIIVFSFWFLNFPTLRYAGYLIVFILTIFPFMIFFSKKVVLINPINLRKISLIFLISFFIFLSKNVVRINSELNLKGNEYHNFNDFPFYWIKNSSFNAIIINGIKFYETNDSCWSTPSTCLKNKDNLNIYTKNNYIFYAINNED